jgi:hypothetical protein
MSGWPPWALPPFENDPKYDRSPACPRTYPPPRRVGNNRRPPLRRQALRAVLVAAAALLVGGLGEGVDRGAGIGMGVRDGGGLSCRSVPSGGRGGRGPAGQARSQSDSSGIRCARGGRRCGRRLPRRAAAGWGRGFGGGWGWNRGNYISRAEPQSWKAPIVGGATLLLIVYQAGRSRPRILRAGRLIYASATPAAARRDGTA